MCIQFNSVGLLGIACSLAKWKVRGGTRNIEFLSKCHQAWQGRNKTLIEFSHCFRYVLSSFVIQISILGFNCEMVSGYQCAAFALALRGVVIRKIEMYSLMLGWMSLARRRWVLLFSLWSLLLMTQFLRIRGQSMPLYGSRRKQAKPIFFAVSTQGLW